MAKVTYTKLPPPVKIYAPVSNYFSIASIFRPLSRGAKRVAFEFDRETPSYKLKISSWETLDAFDLDVLLAVLHIAGKDVKHIDGNHPDVLALEAKGAVHPTHFDTCYAEFTRYELLKILGKSDSQPNYDAVKASLTRLSRVHFNIDYKDVDQWMASSLLSATGLDGDCKVVFNRELGVGLVQNYSRIWFDERSDLSECGRILHTYLSGVIREGGQSFIQFKIDTLVEHVYGEAVAGMERRKLSKCRNNVYTEALKIAKNWTGSSVVNASGKLGDACFTFIRPKR